MRFTPPRAQPLDDSAAPGAVRVHDESQPAAPSARESQRPARPQVPPIPLDRAFRAGHRS
jgi:hypothetical protein